MTCSSPSGHGCAPHTLHSIFFSLLLADARGSAKHKKFTTSSEAQEFLSGPLQYSTHSATTSAIAIPSETSRAHSLSSQTDLSSLPARLQVLAAEGFGFTNCATHHLIVYTDGSSLANGQIGARAGLGVFWGSFGDAAQYNLSERVPGEKQTNNRGELMVCAPFVHSALLTPFVVSDPGTRDVSAS